MFGRRKAPEINPMDQVMTPDGPGLVMSAAQNSDGHYVHFKVSLDDGPMEGEYRQYHIRDLYPLSARRSKAVNYLDHAPEPGQNFDDKA